MKEYLEQSGFLPGIRLEHIFPERWAALVAIAGGFLAALGAAGFSLTLDERILGLSKIALALALAAGSYKLFLHNLKRPALAPGQPEIDRREYGKFLTFHIAEVLHLSYDGTTLSGGSVVRRSFNYASVRWIFSHIHDLAESRNVLENKSADSRYHPSELLSRMFERMVAANRSMMGWEDLFLGMADLNPGLKGILFDLGIKDEDLAGVSDWRRRKDEKRHRPYWSDSTLLEVKGIGKDWSAGYTPNLDQVSRDLTREELLYETPLHMYGHKRYVDLIQKILVGGVHNAIVTGLPGVGRHTVIKALACAINWGKTYGPLRYMRLLQVDTAAVLSHTRTPAEALDRIRLLCNEALWADNVILVINDIDAFFDEGSVEIGRINATEALLPFLKSGLQIVGLTTPAGYQQTIGKNPELARLFGKVEVMEPSVEETLKIVEDEATDIEMKTKIVLGYPALKELVSLATRLIQNLPNPEKSMEVLDAVVMHVAELGEREVTPDHVRKVLTQRTQIPIEKVTGEEKDILLHLEDYLRQRIVGQEEAIMEVSDALRRARAGVRSEKRPIGSFMFLGPTGVGKTETTKALAALYFGSEDRIIRLDMSEFKESSSINRLIGDKPTRQVGLLTEAVIANPFSVILLDELEKAHPSVLDLFLQVLEDGRLTDADGRTVSFANALIIATSNAGSEMMRQMMKAGSGLSDKTKLLEFVQSQGIYKPEFLNRFDAIVVFKPLSVGDQVKIAGMLLKELNQRLAPKEISFGVTAELAEYVVSQAYSPELGARPLRRFIQDNFENYIAKGLISGEIKRGQTLDLSPVARSLRRRA